MHMADALISPAVGGAMWAATAGATAYCARKVKAELDDRKVPLMGVLGAFVFAAQMINFTIPAAGSSGHLGGGMILAALLGPYAAFIVMASVLAVQGLFFADGGLLALGCNIFNLGVFPCFLAYPLIYRKIVGDKPSQARIAAGSLIGAVVGLQFGALAVVLETVASGVTELPFTAFLFLMLPIHLAIGVVEGMATAAVVSFVWRAQPDILARAAGNGKPDARPGRKLLVAFGAAAAIAGGVLSWFASTNPDGLEWSIAKVAGKETIEGRTGPEHRKASEVQRLLSVLPDYGFRKEEAEPRDTSAPDSPGPDAGTSASGLLGGGLVLVLAMSFGWLLKRRSEAR